MLLRRKKGRALNSTGNAPSALAPRRSRQAVLSLEASSFLLPSHPALKVNISLAAPAWSESHS